MWLFSREYQTLECFHELHQLETGSRVAQFHTLSRDWHQYIRWWRWYWREGTHALTPTSRLPECTNKAMEICVDGRLFHCRVRRLHLVFDNVLEKRCTARKKVFSSFPFSPKSVDTTCVEKFEYQTQLIIDFLSFWE